MRKPRGDDADESSPLLDDALRSRGRSGSLSLELLPVDVLLAELEDPTRRSASTPRCDRPAYPVSTAKPSPHDSIAVVLRGIDLDVIARLEVGYPRRSARSSEIFRPALERKSDDSIVIGLEHQRRCPEELPGADVLMEELLPRIRSMPDET